EAVPPHDLGDRSEVGRSSGRGLQDLPHLAEVAGAEDAGREDRQHRGVDVAGVLEMVDDATWDAEGLARADVPHVALHRPPAPPPLQEGPPPPPETASSSPSGLCGAGPFAPGGTSNSKIAPAPAESSPSTRKRTATSPTLISSRVLVAIVRSSPLN